MAPLLSLLLVLSVPSRAEPVRLSVARETGAEACPDAEALARAVAVRLGYSPFSDDAAVQIEVRFGWSGEVLSGRVLRVEAGKPTASRALSSRSPGCEDLAKSVALALCLAIDPMTLLEPSPAAPAAPEVHQEPAPAPPAQTPPQRAGPPQLALGVGGAATLGTGPTVTGSFVVHASVAWRWFSLALEGRAEAPSFGAVPGGSIRTQEFLGVLMPCARLGAGAGCLAFAAGAYNASSVGLSNPSSPSAAILKAGVHLEYGFALWKGLELSPYAELWVPFGRVTVAVSQAPVWTSPLLSGDLGLQLRWRFW